MSLRKSSKPPLTPVFDQLATEVDSWLKTILSNYDPVKVRANKIVRDALSGFISIRTWEIGLIDSPVLQRLRYIHQNSLAYLTYPSTTHTRFEHSLGCVSVAERILQSLQMEPRTAQLEQLDVVETRLAALLHDCGHGPFSHASEVVYFDMATELQSAKDEIPEILGTAAGHEIMSYLIVTSKSFRELLWDKICELHKGDSIYKVLNQVSFDRVGQMIVGVTTNKNKKFLTQIINGPFDADKFDYIVRDGYFSGLITQIDIERMAVSIDVDRDQEGALILCMDIGGATILEQLLFNKMLLFSAMYHHHKVRAAFRQLVTMLTVARDMGISIDGVNLSSPINFLYLEDDKLIYGAMKNEGIKTLAESIRNRSLLKRSLVIDNESLQDSSSRAEWVLFSKDLAEIRDAEEQIAKKAGVDRNQLCIDFPPSPRVDSTAKFSMIRRARDRPLVSLESLYPVSGWLGGYEQFRYRSYILGPEGAGSEIVKATKQVLTNVSIDYGLASSLAKWK